MSEPTIGIKTGYINAGMNDESTVVNVHFFAPDPDGTRSSGTVEVWLPGQNYSLDEVKSLALERAYAVLEKVLTARSGEGRQ